MIHGGGFMTLSKTAIRPAQAGFLLDQGIVPVSVDYRLCPEINLIDGPMTDVRDALSWAQTDFAAIAQSHGIRVDPRRIVVIGWSTGGHLAMTTAWTSLEAGISPPKAILNFYGPSDLKSLGMLQFVSTPTLPLLSKHDNRFEPPAWNPVSRAISIYGINPEIASRETCKLPAVSD